MNQDTAGNVATTPPPDEQEPIFRKLRRSREDERTASLREAQGQGGPVGPTATAAMPSALAAQGKWRRKVDDAGTRWSRLTESDLQRLEGHERTLAELLRERYDIPRNEADRQVMHFLEGHISSTL